MSENSPFQSKPTALAQTNKALPLSPFGDADGAVILHAGRYARESVLIAYEMIGGVERLADWASQNPTEFYTKLFGKVVTREIEHRPSEGLEDLLRRLDATSPNEAEDAPIEDADYEFVEE